MGVRGADRLIKWRRRVRLKYGLMRRKIGTFGVLFRGFEKLGKSDVEMAGIAAKMLESDEN
jgi:hypothetical protein